MNADQIRQSFLEFFEEKGHTVVPSDSLVPENDPTLLFTGAGMNQFKEYFLGLKRDMKRAASSQKCLRTGDLDEVGKTAFHHSFFEMLGNFSFGDYFKEEAITWAWEYLTGVLKISPERLRISVHRDDEEAYKIWRGKIKIRPDWIHQCGDKSNFWPANAPKDGPNGPCGPCSEIYYDQDPGSKDEDIEGRRFAEIWNLVFTQFDRQEGGKLVPLAQKNIDTGMGLERLACVIQGKKTNYEIDIFEPILDKIGEILINTHRADPHLIASQYAIADHARAIVFALSDGVIPANEGRGYVVRKLIRRALWHAHELKPEHEVPAFLYKLVPTIAKVMQKAYPLVLESEKSIASTLEGEEERFLDKLETGLSILRVQLATLSSAGRKIMPGEAVFVLYDTHGFPDELTKKIANAHGFEIDQKGFDRLMEEQRKRAKEASPITSSIFVSSDLEKKLANLPATKFLGYQALEAEGKILFVNLEGQKGIVVLDQTPFYAESGGQVGDQGTLKGPSFETRVTDSQKKDKVVIHAIEITKGKPKEGESVKASVDRNRRDRAMRNHTATHLLHAALRKILGNQVRQLGSLVSPGKLRFDYSYPQPLTDSQIREIEDSVNEQILQNVQVTKEEKSMDEAKKEGAIAFFGEKYGSKVRVVTVPGYSKELCGGTHCDRTGQIGSFVITSDSSIAGGTRRIEALTGKGALEYLRTLRSEIQKIAQSLKSSPTEVFNRVTKLQDTVKKLERQKAELPSAQADPNELLNHAEKVGSINFISSVFKNLDIAQLRRLSDAIRSRNASAVYFLATEVGEKIQYILGMSPSLQKSGFDMLDLGGEKIVPSLGGSGGGRSDLFQGGIPKSALSDHQREAVDSLIISYIKMKAKVT